MKGLGGVRGEITIQESKNIHLWVITYLNRPVLRAKSAMEMSILVQLKKKKVWRSEHFCTDCHYFVNTHWKSHESGTALLQTTLEESLFSGRELCTDNYTVLFWQPTLWFPSWHIISCSKSHTPLARAWEPFPGSHAQHPPKEWDHDDNLSDMITHKLVPRIAVNVWGFWYSACRAIH